MSEDAGTARARILPVDTASLGHFDTTYGEKSLEHWKLTLQPSHGTSNLQTAATRLRESNVPVAFPTETVYGLGADATRSDAVKGIYAAKGRPSDNPLIIHVCDLQQLRSILPPAEDGTDAIPSIYAPLIERFWPGPLTILLPNSPQSGLAPEVTAGLPTFGARMPASELARTLISLVGAPLAAPSANASTKPSPTTAAHVLHDLADKIDVILDGGPCSVGVESTVVDGLCSPPVVLRPGGVSMAQIRECAGWEGVVKGYRDQSQVGDKSQPRAPGMKYKHYSPKAKVVLYETATMGKGSPEPHMHIKEPVGEAGFEIGGALEDSAFDAYDSGAGVPAIGIIRTRYWRNWAGWDSAHHSWKLVTQERRPKSDGPYVFERADLRAQSDGAGDGQHMADVMQVTFENDVSDVARGLFAALRELDGYGVRVIYIEGVGDDGDTAAAVMNRLRKAATVIVQPMIEERQIT